MTAPDRLAAYLDRIGLAAAPQASPEGLAALVSAHRLAIGFSNLELRLGRPVRIDSASAFDKVVTRRRGGYCFEQNRVFSDMLAACGMANRPLLARVWLGVAPDIFPSRSHVTLLVELDGAQWLADAGFGGSFLPPLPLADGATIRTADGVSHRLRRIGALGEVTGQWLLERAGAPRAGDGRAEAHDDWQPQYTFDLGEVAPIDLEQSSHWTSTRPDQRFTTLHVASIALPAGFASLVERTLTTHDGGKTHELQLNDPGDYARVLQDLFDLDYSLAEVKALPLFAA
jgi:N-hydroxyarylamine O-acetyltransferase